MLPQWLARALGLAALASIGALEWQRLIGGLASARALLWVVAALVGAAGVLAAGRVRPGWPRAFALGGVTAAALLAGYIASGTSLVLLKPHHWDELGPGLVDGVQALGTVRLPYVSANPWPAIAVKLLGAELLVLAGLLTFWPRPAGAEPAVGAPVRSLARAPGRGYPFVALAVLMIVVASPIVSIGGTRQLVLGLVLAALTMCFLWLERLPLRPGLGVGALIAVALAGALPLAAFADRGEPWFDYRSFAESLGPDDPVNFSWTQTYGPISWPRQGDEVFEVKSSDPLYWKARDLDDFNGIAWQMRQLPTAVKEGDPAYSPDVVEGWANTPAWTSTISVDIRRMRTSDVIGAGTIVKVSDESRQVKPGLAAGTFDSVGALRRGDSYTLQVHTPNPGAALLALASSGARQRQSGELVLEVPFKVGGEARLDPSSGYTRPRQAEVHFKPWSGAGTSYASYNQGDRSEFEIDQVMQRSLYARTWALVTRLKAGAHSPYQYIQRVDQYLHGPSFRYDERPPQAPQGQAPLDFFINESHAGYCQHFAGAEALMLRMGGIPARVATGFSPGGFSSRKNAWIVRDTDAHAWVEAWFDRYGWVTFDPTPAATPARSQIAAISIAAAPSTLATSRPTPTSRDGSGRPAIRVRPDLLLDQSAQTKAAAAANSGTPWWLYGGAGLVLLLAAAALVALHGRPRGPVAELEDALRRVGRPVTTGTTLFQLERRLGSYSPEAAAYLHALTAGRYAAAPPKPSRAGRRALRRVLAQGLGPTGRLRAFWALPPRVR